jgi:hypothetical protein
MSPSTPAPPRPSYTKPWKSYEDQVALLQTRGLVVADSVVATTFFRHVNYHRFSGYCLAFEQARHQFRTGVTFEQVRAAYDFVGVHLESLPAVPDPLAEMGLTANWKIHPFWQ